MMLIYLQAGHENATFFACAAFSRQVGRVYGLFKIRKIVYIH